MLGEYRSLWSNGSGTNLCEGSSQFCEGLHSTTLRTVRLLNLVCMVTYICCSAIQCCFARCTVLSLDLQVDQLSRLPPHTSRSDSDITVERQWRRCARIPPSMRFFYRFITPWTRTYTRAFHNLLRHKYELLSTSPRYLNKSSSIRSQCFTSPSTQPTQHHTEHAYTRRHLRPHTLILPLPLGYATQTHIRLRRLHTRSAWIRWLRLE